MGRPALGRAALAAAMLALPAALFAFPAGAAAAGCAPAGATVLRQSALASIYTRAGVLYGCAGASTTRLGAYQPGKISGPTRVASFALAGRYAAVDTVAMGVDTFRSTVSLYDLAGGATALAVDPAAAPPPRPEFFVTVAALRVSAAGIAAWVARISAIGMPKPDYELHAMTAEHDRLIASATTAFTALGLSGHTLSWRAAPGGPVHHRSV